MPFTCDHVGYPAVLSEMCFEVSTAPDIAVLVAARQPRTKCFCFASLTYLPSYIRAVDWDVAISDQIRGDDEQLRRRSHLISPAEE